MRNIIAALVISTACLSMNNLAQAQDENKGISIDHIFIPSGFDSNDEVEFVVTGVLPSPCYEAPKVVFNKTGKSIALSAYASFKGGKDRICPRVVVPYSRTIEIGQLPPSVYRVFFKNSSRTIEKEILVIKEAPKNNIDNFYYGNVQKVEVSKDNSAVAIHYYKMSSCMKFDRLHPVFNGRDVVTLLPILRFTGKDCFRTKELKSVYWKVPSEMQGNTFLIHVRSMGGQSLNTMANGGMNYPDPKK